MYSSTFFFLTIRLTCLVYSLNDKRRGQFYSLGRLIIFEWTSFDSPYTVKSKPNDTNKENVGQYRVIIVINGYFDRNRGGYLNPSSVSPYVNIISVRLVPHRNIE